MTLDNLPFAASAPISVSRVALKARDADALAKFYKEVVGLAEIARAPGHVTLGAGGRPLLEIEASPKAKPDDLCLRVRARNAGKAAGDALYKSISTRSPCSLVSPSLSHVLCAYRQ